MARDMEGRLLAEKIHSVAIRLLRRLRKSDALSGLPGPKLSVLSVLVFGGPHTLKALAAAEQVRAPTMSRLVAELETLGFVTKVRDREDTRVVHVQATAKGRAVLEAGKARRLDPLAAQLRGLTVQERRVLSLATEILGRLNDAD